ncbi:hypothetical protein [Marinomonas atlantica]|uniref:hypothetical protein n=1 Tax=Marinomonas atlantica TaxID=1806668 RepID=UPI00082F5FF0|nr:hypothetical protein [Marinomonas atlantica]
MAGMGDMFNGGGGYSLSGGSATAGGNDKVGGGYSGIAFGVLPPLPSLSNFSTNNGETSFSTGLSNPTILLIGVAALAAGVFVIKRGG